MSQIIAVIVTDDGFVKHFLSTVVIILVVGKNHKCDTSDLSRAFDMV